MVFPNNNVLRTLLWGKPNCTSGSSLAYFIGLLDWILMENDRSFSIRIQSVMPINSTKLLEKRAIQPTPFSNKLGWLDGPVADWAGPTPKNKGTTFLIS